MRPKTSKMTRKRNPVRAVKQSIKVTGSVPERRSKRKDLSSVMVMDEDMDPVAAKKARELAAKRIVDEVTRNLKFQARSFIEEPPKRRPRKLVTIDVKNPMQYFMFQYKILESCALSRDAERSGPGYTNSKPDCYGFMTFVVKRFIVSLTKLIQQVDPNFSALKWDKDTLDTDFKIHPVPVSESNSSISYLESVFGKLPGSSPATFEDVFPGKKPPVDIVVNKGTAAKRVNPRMSTGSLISNTEKEKVVEGSEGGEGDGLKNQVDTAIQQLDEDIENNEDYDDGGAMNDDVESDLEVLEKGPDLSNTVEKVSAGTLDIVKPKRRSLGARNIDQLLCTYCHKTGFDFMGHFVSHMMVEHFAKKVIEFVCEKCNQCAVLSSKSSLSSCVNHANGKCLQLKNENTKTQLNEVGLTYIKCGLCGFKSEAVYQNDLLRLDTDEIVDHFIETHNAENRCDYCNRYFSTPEVFEVHREYCNRPEGENIVRPEIYYYMQNKCGVHNITFQDEFAYADHSLQFHLLDISGGEIVRVLDLHLPSLTIRKDQKLGLNFPCNICGRDKVTFQTAHEWSDHAASAHKSAGFQCDICCKFLGCIKQHNRNTHSFLDEFYYSCNIDDCLYKGALFENVLCHLKSFHPPDARPERMKFKKHCAADGCDYNVDIEYSHGSLTKDYKRKSRELSSHYERKHMKKFCDKCGRFVSKSYYEQHLESHLAEETGHKKYTCTHCDQKFTHKKSLMDHAKRHDVKNKTHICHQCGKKFFTSGDLCTHVKITHATEAEKQFICEHCNKGFARRGLLRAHQKQCCSDVPQGIRKPSTKSTNVSSAPVAAPIVTSRLEMKTAVSSISSYPKLERIENISPVNSGGLEEIHHSNSNPSYTQSSHTLTHTHQPPIAHHATHSIQHTTHPTPDQGMEQNASNDNVATDLRIPVLHQMESYDPQGRSEDFAQNLLQQYQRLPAFAQRDLGGYDPQSHSHLSAFFAQYQNYQ